LALDVFWYKNVQYHQRNGTEFWHIEKEPNPTLIGSQEPNPTLIGSQEPNPTMIGSQEPNPTLIGSQLQNTKLTLVNTELRVGANIVIMVYHGFG